MAGIHNPAMMRDDRRVGKVMRFLRRRSKVSRQVMAGQLSVLCRTYQNYEDGTYSVPDHRLLAFLDYLKISLAEFETAFADIDVLSQTDDSADMAEEARDFVDSFATLDSSSRNMVMEMVRHMLQQEFPELALKQGTKKKK